MLLAVLLQSAAAAGLGKLGAALGAAIAVIGNTCTDFTDTDTCTDCSYCSNRCRYRYR